MNYAPIIIFALNRLEPLKATVASVLQITEAAESDLYVFVDGARPCKEGEAEKVKAVILCECNIIFFLSICVNI